MQARKDINSGLCLLVKAGNGKRRLDEWTKGTLDEWKLSQEKKASKFVASQNKILTLFNSTITTVIIIKCMTKDVHSISFLPSRYLFGRCVAVNICGLKGESYSFERQCFNEERGGMIFDWNANFLFKFIPMMIFSFIWLFTWYIYNLSASGKGQICKPLSNKRIINDC